MTRWAMVADLNRCVGCQTCTAACKHANATAPGIQWRRVLDIETGAFPEVRRAFMPVGCMHCDDPPCVSACPSGATFKREDGLVVIDYDICIGCAYCAIACPYQARFKVTGEEPAFGRKAGRMRHEAAREMPERLNVAQKCTFCIDRIDAGLARGLTPGVDPEATPACADACIADALVFGDLDNPESRVSRLLEDHESFVMHDDLGTGPGFHYLWAPEGAEEAAEPAAPLVIPGETGLTSVAPWHQASWDWRAAANFICGGAGSGLIVAGVTAGLAGGGPLLPALVAGLGLVGLGLLCVWAEIGRPLRFLNVFSKPATSWMSREAWVAVALFATGGAAIGFGWTGAGEAASAAAGLAAALALGFLYAQARILNAAMGIPLWREGTLLPLVLATGLTEGTGLALGGAAAGLLPGASWLAIALAVLLGLRLAAWAAYRRALALSGAPERALEALARFAPGWLWAGHGLPLGLLALALLLPAAAAPVVLALAGIVAAVAGGAFKLVLVTRAAFNQGFALARMPRRGAGRAGPGLKPGWCPPAPG